MEFISSKPTMISKVILSLVFSGAILAQPLFTFPKNSDNSNPGEICYPCTTAITRAATALSSTCRKAFDLLSENGFQGMAFSSVPEWQNAQTAWCSDECKPQVQSFLGSLQGQAGCEITSTFGQGLCMSTTQRAADATSNKCIGDNFKNMQAASMAIVTACVDSFEQPDECAAYTGYAAEYENCDNMVRKSVCQAMTCCDYIGLSSSTLTRQAATQYCTVNGTDYFSPLASKAQFCDQPFSFGNSAASASVSLMVILAVVIAALF